MTVQALPEWGLSPASPLGRAFIEQGCATFHAAAAHVWHLPYGRTSDRADYRLVLEEGCGTCATKHALLAAVAREHGVALGLVLGIYEMCEANTPGVGGVLRRHGLAALPEAHCYLASGGERVDLTRVDVDGGAITTFLHEEVIEPEQIGAYKVTLHQRVLRDWSRERGLSFDEVWAAREGCIAALEKTGRHGVIGR